MRLVSLDLKNFRGYRNAVKIEFDELTAIVGKNDVGKSTILEALDIFFNDGKGVVKLDSGDANKYEVDNENNEISIGVCFEDLPEAINIDNTAMTNLAEEYLLNEKGQLEIIKKYNNGKLSKVLIKANHPKNPNCLNLLSKKNSELKSIINQNNITCDKLNVNSVMRKAIRDKYKEDLRLEEYEIELSKEDAKKLWEKLNNHLPIYFLFQSDRNNSDSDNEIQDPLKLAVKELFADEGVQERLSEISNIVRERIQDVSNRTLDKLKEMDGDIAKSLIPVIPDDKDLKWYDVFKNVSIFGDEGIPINKRGSGVRRLILLNFFRAEVEKRVVNNDTRNIIYAIEEPETSQHTDNQYKLIEALKVLSQSPKRQVLITTHSANIVKRLAFNNLRTIKNFNNIKSIESIDEYRLNTPSLNEVNYIAFGEVNEEYHNELYGVLEFENILNEYISGKNKIEYLKVQNNGHEVKQHITITEYIRHQIHHPENKRNRRFTLEELRTSIEMMREFIAQQMHK